MADLTYKHPGSTKSQLWKFLWGSFWKSYIIWLLQLIFCSMLLICRQSLMSSKVWWKRNTPAVANDSSFASVRCRLFLIPKVLKQSLHKKGIKARYLYCKYYHLRHDEPSTKFMVSISELRNTFLNLDLVKKPLKRHSSEPLLIDSINQRLESASEAAAQKEAIEGKVKGSLVGKMNSVVGMSCYIYMIYIYIMLL